VTERVERQPARPVAEPLSCGPVQKPHEDGGCMWPACGPHAESVILLEWHWETMAEGLLPAVGIGVPGGRPVRPVTSRLCASLMYVFKAAPRDRSRRQHAAHAAAPAGAKIFNGAALIRRKVPGPRRI
jgi:hypothetical protein